MLVTLIGWFVVVSATILPLTKGMRRMLSAFTGQKDGVRRGFRSSWSLLGMGFALLAVAGIAGAFLFGRGPYETVASGDTPPVGSGIPSVPDQAIPGAIFYADFEQDSATFVDGYVNYADSTPGFTRIFTGGNNCLRLGTTTERAFEGARSFEISWAGDTLPVNHTPPPIPPQSACELRGTLGGGTQEVWFRTMMYVPDNYIQRNVVGKSENDKVLWVCGGYACQEERDPYDVKVIAEFNAYETAPGDSSLLKPNWGTNASDGGLVISQHGLAAVKFIEPEDRGTWVDLCLHFRISDDTTAVSPPNSLMRAWKGSTQVWDYSGFALRDAQNEDEEFWHFYLMGANNGGYPDTTRFYFDNLGFYDSDPGCGT